MATSTPSAKKPRPAVLRGKSQRAHLADWPAEIPGRCNFRKPHFLRCKNYPMKGLGTDGQHCKKHQRAIGEDVAGFKGGTSKGFMRRHVPQHLLQRFDEIVNNPELTSVRELLALSGARLSEVLDKVPAQQSDLAWDNLGEMLNQFGAAIGELKDGSPIQQRLIAVLGTMQDNYRTAMHERHAWNDVHREIERTRRLAETERKREEMLQANLTGNQAIALFNKLFDIITEEIQDLGLRRKIGTRIMTTLADGPMALGPGITLHTKEGKTNGH